MAKRKNTAALFEVYHDARGASSRSHVAPSAVGSVISGFRAWFKARGERAAQAEIDPNDPTSAPIKSPLIVSRMPAVDTVTVSSSSPTAVAPQPQPAAPAVERSVNVAAVTIPSLTPRSAMVTDQPRTVAANSSSLTTAAESRPHAQRHSHIRFDHDRKEVTLRLRLNTAVVTCFGIVLTVALAYVMGRRAGTRPVVLAAADGQGTSQVAEVKPSALDLPRRIARAPVGAGTGGTTIIRPTPRPAEPHEHNPPVANQPHTLVPEIPATPREDAKRPVGLNYFIMHDSPSEAGAIEARDFFAKNGIACTAERMPAGYNQNLFAVISWQGFERLSAPECEALKKQIEKVEGQLAATTRSKRFFPVAFKLK